MDTASLVTSGHAYAERILQIRQAASTRRERVIGPLRNQLLAAGPPAIAVTRTPNAGTLLAEGDSWFDYPFHDVLKTLEDDYGYEVEKVAHRGDTIEDMAYGGGDSTTGFGGQLEELTRRLEKLIRIGMPPKALLLSGGGNDLAGDAFAMILNHVNSGAPALEPGVLNGVIGTRIRSSYIVILTAITHICQAKLGSTIPIIVHGYDYPVPDGRGFLGGWGPLPGPWLEPGFRIKGYTDLPQKIGITRELIDALNQMLQGLIAIPEFRHVKHADLRNTLSVDLVSDHYKEFWANELHPTRKGFELVTAKIQAALP